RAGNFTYTRRSDRVDVRLTLDGPGGTHLEELSTFVGKLPEGSRVSAELRQQRDDLAKEAAKLREDLKVETDRSRTLERTLEDMQKQLKRDQQKRRPANTPVDPLGQ